MKTRTYVVERRLKASKYRSLDAVYNETVPLQERWIMVAGEFYSLGEAMDSATGESLIFTEHEHRIIYRYTEEVLTIPRLKSHLEESSNGLSS